jgi:hypothetical protein
MNNNERRSRIQGLKDRLHPLRHDEISAALTYKFLLNRYPGAEGRESTYEQTEELERARKTLKDLESAIAPLFTEMRSLQVKYEVEYEGEVWDGGKRTMVRNKKEFFLSTDCAIDTSEDGPDHHPELPNIMIELTDYIYNQEYGVFKFRRIRRV